MHLEARRERLLPVLGPRVRRQRDGGEGVPRRQAADLPQERVAVLARHTDVAEEDVRPPARECGERLGGRLAHPDVGTVPPQDRLENLARVRLVVDHEDAEAVEPSARRGGWRLRLGRARRRLPGRDLDRQPHREGGALTLARALRVHGAPVQLDDVADDREAEAQAAVRPPGRGVALPEALEDVWEEGGRDALARVAHRELDVRVGGRELHLDAPVLGRELDRVREEVPRHLLEALRVAPDRVDPRMDRLHDADVLGHGRGPHALDRRVDHVGEAYRLHLQAHLPADDARHLEQVVDQVRLRPGAALDRLERA